MPLDFHEQPPCYISNRMVHKILGDKIQDLSSLIAIAIQKGEYGGAMNSLKLVNAPYQHKTIAYNKFGLFIIDNDILNAAITAALVLSVFLAQYPAVSSFSIEVDTFDGLYLAQAMLNDNLCKKILVQSRMMAKLLDDERVSVGTDGDGRFINELDEVSPPIPFLAVRSWNRRTTALSKNFDAKITVDPKRVNEEWTSLFEVFRGLEMEGPVLFVYSQPHVCKTIAVKMILDAMEKQHGMP